MKKIFIALILIIFVSIPAFANREYYIKKDSDYNLQFLCFNNSECYSLNSNTIQIKNKKFVGFGDFHYFDLSTYKYDKNTHTYSVDILVDRDPFTDLDVCNKCPYDKGNITHLIFSLIYTPLTKNFHAKYKGFVSSVDVLQYKNGKPFKININYLNLYYDNNPKNIKDLSDWLKFFNKEVVKNFDKNNSLTAYNVEIEYIIPYYLNNILNYQYNPKD